MQVWEVIAALSKLPAGCKVCVAHNSESYIVDLERIDDDTAIGDGPVDSIVTLFGDGRATIEEDDEQVVQKKHRKK